ncbi:DUF389 domain-containing protein [Cellulomonas soli]|uniref:Membrane protein n=1 Tax=Cellulomonas soli TaxID=931535 RepID=A0A512PC89_9CELL|nr:DUF389 domain-containing protein [Cellulomonas soli]NYI58408.1 putative hydrophobic protein (TIGR00271 family) [Cellulomonas soli]GEP68830.1 membrane protein [Cellulomonas soli]
MTSRARRRPSLRTWLLPASQRRTIAELHSDLDLTEGDSASKRSAFWVMLALSSIIATAGVLADSTATVIGAMIIAPLSTPIMGTALGLAQGERRTGLRASGFVLAGSLLAVGIGIGFSALVPGDIDLLANSQIAGRTSPGLLDLAAAIATGFAGAVALSRKDVAAVLPGVAISISLVPPLAVVGVCLGAGSPTLAYGAALLFASNLLALVLAGTLIFAALGYGDEGAAAEGRPRRRASLTVGLLLALVAVPLATNSAFSYLVTVLTARVQTIAQSWVAAVPGASITDVTFVSSAVHVDVQTPGEIPPVDDLLASLTGTLPDGIPVVVTTSLGEQIDAGVVGRD